MTNFIAKFGLRETDDFKWTFEGISHLALENFVGPTLWKSEIIQIGRNDFSARSNSILCKCKNHGVVLQPDGYRSGKFYRPVIQTCTADFEIKN